MTASPAQVANDLAAQGQYWQRRDGDVGRACFDGAQLIRCLLEGSHADGFAASELRQRLDSLWRRFEKQNIYNNPSNSLHRGVTTIDELQRARVQSK